MLAVIADVELSRCEAGISGPVRGIGDVTFGGGQEDGVEPLSLPTDLGKSEPPEAA